jgi:BirA family biotin operon repressor/biotin-[acetyl-CoA-carboxylase] ligase
MRERFDTRVIGAALHLHDEIDSTNLEALRLAKAGAPEGTLVVARTQTAGRGRLGRTWADAPGGSLLMTALVAPPSGIEWMVTPAAALAVAEAIRDWLYLPAMIKWPNDVLSDDRKVAGVLAEGSAGAVAGGPATGLVAVGIGVNVTGDTDGLPEELHGRAGFLSEGADRALDPDDMFAALLPRLDESFLALREGDARRIIARIREMDWLRGRRVTLSGAGENVSGVAEGWTDTGTLILRADDGALTEFAAGVVTVADEAELI